MKILWLDLNSSHSHASLALPAIHAQPGDPSVEWTRLQATIHSRPADVAADIARQRPHLIAASLWLFTREPLLKILARAKVLLPSAVTLLGGPETLGDNEPLLRAHPCVNAVLRGEGEIAFHAFLPLLRHPLRWNEIPGLCYIHPDGHYHDGGLAPRPDIATLRPPELSPFFDTTKPFVQLETSRGCFNTCVFCVSGGDRPVRLLPLPLVSQRLRHLRDLGVREIRLIDRTFNANPARAIDLLRLFATFAGQLRFHLEIHPALLTPALLAVLRDMPPGLLHLEAGIQSLRPTVLRLARRRGTPVAALRGLGRLLALPNLVVHADLIAGLPGYTLTDLLDDTLHLVAAGVHELQVELLKVLPGTALHRLATRYRLLYSPDPPYEILATPRASTADLRVAHLLSRFIDAYYNAPAWQPFTRRLLALHPDALPDLLSWLDQRQLLDQPLSLERRGQLLHDYCAPRYPDLLPALAVHWVLAGLPLARVPGLPVLPFRAPLPPDLTYLHGTPAPVTRLYRLPAPPLEYIFGFDRSVSPSVPLFVARHPAP